MNDINNAFRRGDLVAARRSLQTLQPHRSRHLEMLAAIDYLEGNYTGAITRLASVGRRTRANPFRSYRIRRQLSLAYFQTNQFDKAASLSLGDPLSRLMASFSGAPNVVAWNGLPQVRLAFLQESTWELPRIDITVNGQTLEAKIDTGGDLLSVPWSMAKTLGTNPVATATGRFAGGSKAEVGWSQAANVDLGGVAITNVPVSLNRFPHAVVGTGLLRQFLATLDYPRHELVLRPRGTPRRQAGIPFLMAGTHLIVASGTISGIATKLLVDSGLEADNGASILASDRILRQAGVRPTRKTGGSGVSGAGTTQVDIGSFSVDEASVGPVTRRDLTGLTGVMPKQLTRAHTIGFPLGGLVSHNFLRHYRWTLDFERMQMTLEPPQPGS